jgi:2-dehydropantoate 2-reductase
MKICIYGCGSIGGYIAAHLARSGRCDVSVVGHGKTLHAIQTQGLRVIEQDDFTVPVRAVADPAELGIQDYVFITLKVNQVDTALDGIRTLIGPDTAIIPPTTGLPYYFLNGFAGRYADKRLPRIDPGGRLWAAMPPSQVLGCPYWIGVHSPAPAVVQLDGTLAILPMGELDGSRSERVARLSAVLEASGIQAPVSNNIHGDVWTKFVNALCLHPVAILTMAPIGEIFASAPAVVRTIMEEADRIGRELGVVIPSSAEDRIARTLRGGAMHKTSMLQDFERGRPIELEILYDSLRSLTEITGLSAPTLDAVYALARLRAAMRTGTPHLSALACGGDGSGY